MASTLYEMRDGGVYGFNTPFECKTYISILSYIERKSFLAYIIGGSFLISSEYEYSDKIISINAYKISADNILLCSVVFEKFFNIRNHKTFKYKKDLKIRTNTETVFYFEERSYIDNKFQRFSERYFIEKDIIDNEFRKVTCIYKDSLKDKILNKIPFITKYPKFIGTIGNTNTIDIEK